jgi:hypothetical protein
MPGESAALNKTAQDKTKAVQDFAKESGAGLQQTGQVSWDTLAAGGVGEPGAPRFSLDFRDEFDRADLEAGYIALVSQPTTSYDQTPTTNGDVLLNRTQAHWLAQVERDYLLRRRTRVRAEAHAAAMRTGLGSDKGSISMGIRWHLKRLLALASLSRTKGVGA